MPADHRIEIVEGEKSFSATPFRQAVALSALAPTSQAAEKLPHRVETWLVEPLPAPAFSLSDLSGSEPVLSKTSRALPLLLTFWVADSLESLDLLDQLQQRNPLLHASGLALLAVNVDKDPAAARSLAVQRQFAFPVLFADETVSGIYNLVYRHLFDRRRNLPLPASFLLDSNGSIVKVYQGTFDPQQLAARCPRRSAHCSRSPEQSTPVPGKDPWRRLPAQSLYIRCGFLPERISETSSRDLPPGDLPPPRRRRRLV